MVNINHLLIDVDNRSELELLVMLDIIDQGYDPTNKDHIENFWREKLQ